VSLQRSSSQTKRTNSIISILLESS
jgi:hypothetical protein